MTYYLSKQSEQLLPPILKLLKDPSKGEVELHTNSVDGLIQLLRNAANTRYPDLKRWRFRKGESCVRAFPKHILVETPVHSINDHFDYLGIISYLVTNPEISKTEFTDIELSELERDKLQSFLLKRNLHVTFISPTHLQITNESTE